MDFAESAEQRALRETIRAVATPFGGARYAESARQSAPQEELWRELGKLGFIGINVPSEYGGGGGGLVELAAVTEETAAAGAPLLLLLVSSAISVEVLARYGSSDQRAEWLPRMATGEAKIVFAITEPDAGSNSHRIETTATRDGDTYVLRGTKSYITGVDQAEALIVVARTGVVETSDQARLSLFLVDADAPSMRRSAINVDAMLPETQFELFFEEVRVPADRLIGEQDAGFAQVFHGLNPERITGAALCVGVGRYALERAADYARVRQVWGQPIGAHQGVAHPLAKAKVEVELAALMTAKAAWLHDHSLPAGEASNMAKYAAAEAALAAVDAAIQTHGGNGLSSDYGLLSLWSIARLMRIAPINREMILNYVAQHSLGLPRSY